MLHNNTSVYEVYIYIGVSLPIGYSLFWYIYWYGKYLFFVDSCLVVNNQLMFSSFLCFICVIVGQSGCGGFRGWGACGVMGYG